MPKDQLKIPQFKSLEEFWKWWESPEVREFCQHNPDKVEKLREYHLVKPWLEQIKTSEKSAEQPQVSTKTFGKYSLEKKLGQGGMGVVYLAHDPTLNRKVALKIMTIKG